MCSGTGKLYFVSVCSGWRPNPLLTYRFSQPDQPTPLVLPQKYSAGSVVRIPVEPKIIGDHLRRKRLASKMFQNDLAKKLGVSVAGYHNWECNATTPEVRYMPAIIKFIGYDPLPVGNGWGERLVRHRKSLGLIQKEAAAEIGVDQGTLAKWERGERQPAGEYLRLVGRFLDTAAL